MDATCYGAISPQYLFGTAKPVTDVPVSNNCQNLNIWTKTLDVAAKKTCHGLASRRRGSLEAAAMKAGMMGKTLSRYGDVVVVTVNHRLNVLGAFGSFSLWEEIQGFGQCRQYGHGGCPALDPYQHCKIWRRSLQHHALWTVRRRQQNFGTHDCPLSEGAFSRKPSSKAEPLIQLASVLRQKPSVRKSRKKR